MKKGKLMQQLYTVGPIKNMLNKCKHIEIISSQVAVQGDWNCSNMHVQWAEGQTVQGKP